MTTPLPLVLVRLHEDEDRSLVVVSRSGQPPNRPIHTLEIVGQFATKDGEPDLHPASFARNKFFADFLHESIARNGPSIPGIIEAAEGQDGTYVYMIDGRTPTPQGRVPNEDIIGCFQVEHGRVTTEGYQRFSEHRLFTERGFFQLDSRLIELILDELDERCGLPQSDA